VATTSDAPEAVTSARGLRIIPDCAHRRGRFVIPADDGPAAGQLDQAIDDMGARYGPAARRFAVTGMEYVAPAVQPDARSAGL